MRPSPATSPATALKTQSVSNPSRDPGNRRQDPRGMEMNRLSTLAIVLIAVCGLSTAVVIGLTARLCILRERRSGRFVSLFFFNYFLNVIFLHQWTWLTCAWVTTPGNWRYLFCPHQDRFLWIYIFMPNSPVSISCEPKKCFIEFKTSSLNNNNKAFDHQ